MVHQEPPTYATNQYATPYQMPCVYQGRQLVPLCRPLRLHSRVKRIDSGYKLIEVLSGGRGSADTVVNVATV